MAIVTPPSLVLLSQQTAYRTAHDVPRLDQFIFGPHTRRSIEAFQAGHEAFFAPLKADQPRTWALLMERTCEMLVVQSAHPDVPSLAEHHVVVPVPAGLVAFRAFDKLDERDDMDLMLAAVPAGLRCYQQTCSSVGLSNGEAPCAPQDRGTLSVGLPDRRLFCAVRERERLGVYRSTYRIPKKALARMERELGDLMHIRALSADYDYRNVLLIDQNTPAAQKLYCVMDRKYEDFFELADPVAAVDAYFSTVLQGDFRRFDFTPYRA
jgi:hypothetical protein